jgi:hypothetical protein
VERLETTHARSIKPMKPMLASETRIGWAGENALYRSAQDSEDKEVFISFSFQETD